MFDHIILYRTKQADPIAQTRKKLHSDTAPHFCSGINQRTATSLLTACPRFIMMTRYFNENSAVCFRRHITACGSCTLAQCRGAFPPQGTNQQRAWAANGSGGFTVFFFADCCLIVYSGVIRRARIVMCTRRVWLPDLARPFVQPLYSGRKTGKSWLPESPPVCGVHPSEWYVLVHAFWRQGLCFC